MWFGLPHMAKEEALFETPLYRDFFGFSSAESFPHRVSILRFSHLIEKHLLRLQGTYSVCIGMA